MRPTVRVATVVLSCLVLAVTSFAAGAGAGYAACDESARAGAWTAMDAPGKITVFAASPTRIYASDGRSLFITSDNGCTWSTPWQLPELPSAEYPFVNETITTIAVDREAIYLGVSGPHVLVSDDGGHSWTRRDDGLTPGGAPAEILFAPSDERTVYMTVEAHVSDDVLNNGITAGQGITGKTTPLYRSTDGGRTWALASTRVWASTRRAFGLATGTDPGAIWDAAVDPIDPAVVWIGANNGLFVSRDWGESWVPILHVMPDIRALDVHRIGDSVEVTAIDPSTGVYYTSRDGTAGPWKGRAFVGFQTAYALDAADAMSWMAHSDDGDVFASGPKGVFERRSSAPVDRWVDVSPLGLGSGYVGTLTDLMADPGAPGVILGRIRSGSTILRYEPPAPATRGPARGNARLANALGPLDVVPTSIGALAHPSPPTLLPRTSIVRLRPGQTASRKYTLHLPPRPSPLDVFFLLDSTESMTNVIRSLARSVGVIATELRAEGIDVHVGLGEFRTHQLPGSSDFTYRRDLDLQTPGPRLARALLAIEGAGRSGANLTALYQAVTGEGQDVAPIGPSDNDIPPGLNATFRPGALPVIVHAADTYFGTPERGDPGFDYPPGTWPGPGFDPVIAALRNAGVMQVGVAVGASTEDSPPPSTPTALADLRTVAAGTATTAAAPTDCDADGVTDLRPGAPLVCGLSPDAPANALAPAIVSLLEGIEDTGVVSLEETTSSGAVRAIDPDTYPAVDFRHPNKLEFRVSYECDGVHPPRATDVRLAAVLDEARVATATATVKCSPKPGAVPFALPERPVVVAVPPPVAPPPPPQPNPAPGPAHAPAPAAEPAPAPAQAPAGQPQAVVVQQRQTQPQVAFVHAAQQVRQQLGMERAMVRTSQSRSDPLAATKYGLAAGSLTLILLWGMATAVARSPRAATVRSLRRMR